MKKAALFLIICPIFVFNASASDEALLASESAMAPVIRRYQTDAWSLGKFYNVPMSPLARERKARFNQSWLTKLDKIDFDKLGVDGRIDWLLLRDHLNNEIRRLKEDESDDKELSEILPFAETMIRLEEDRRAMKPLDARTAAATLGDLKGQVEQIQKRIASGLDPKSEDKNKLVFKMTHVRRALNTLRWMKRGFGKWYDHYHGYDPEFSWWAEKPYTALNESLENYAGFLRKSVLKIKKGEEEPIIGDPIGAEAFRGELAHEMIPYSPEELIAIGRKELAWCKAEMKKAAADMGLGDDWQAAMERTKQDFVLPGQQDELIIELAHEAVNFLETNELVTIPDLAKETWRVEMMSLEAQKFTPFFYYGGQHIAVAYPTNAVDHDQKLMSLRANNRHFSRATVHHELIPGHHLQGFMRDRYSAHRDLFGTPFLGEGWALYWEMLLWDLNFQKTPENRMGMLFWRAHRCARIIVSLSFHLEQMSIDEMIDFLVDEIGHERDSATAEVRRYVAGDYGPLYQCAYMLGGLQIRALHKDLVDSGKMTNRAFHDAILHQGSMPVEMIRAALTGTKLEKNYKTNWKFYK